MTNPAGQIQPTPAADFLAMRDPGTRNRAILDDIAAQERKAIQQRQAQVHADHDPTVVKMMNEQIQAAAAEGDHLKSIALKQQLANYLNNPYPLNLKGYSQ
jgi:hypothetical protein